jgi:hypothetical protein
MKFTQAVVAALVTLCHVPSPVSASLVEEVRSLQEEQANNNVGADFKKETPTPRPTAQPSTASPTSAPCFTMSFTSNGITDGRIFRDVVPGVCDAPKPFPGIIFTGNDFQYMEIPVFVSAAVPSCVTIDWTLGSDCVTGATGPLIHASAYTDFNPLDQTSGFLGDLGGSDLIQFAFALDAGEDFNLVVQQMIIGTTPPSTCSFQMCKTVTPL